MILGASLQGVLLRAQSSSGGTPQKRPQSPAAQPSKAGDAGIANASQAKPLRSRVNLISIRVVVRDKHGAAVGSLHKQDFRVFEDHKQQDIDYFSVETANGIAPTIETPNSAIQRRGEVTPSEPATVSVRPTHFVAFLFDDTHIALGDLAQTRAAAMRFVDNELQPNDRVGIFTTSGQSQTDFTTNRKELQRALIALREHPASGAETAETRQCPTIDYYQADLMLNRHDPNATNVAVFDALHCAFNDDLRALPMAQALARSTAHRVNDAGERATRDALQRLDQAVQTMAALPGQRGLVLLSPGFICPTTHAEFDDLISRANRLNVFIDTLDARGVYTPDLGDAGMTTPSIHSWAGGGSGGWLMARDRLRTAGQSARFQVLDAIADGTGGRSFHQNDLGNELSNLAEVPAVSYLLGFTPRDLKPDGKFHSLKVTVDAKGVTVQARRGFYDPQANGAVEAEDRQSEPVTNSPEQELERVAYSQEVENGVPVELDTAYKKLDGAKTELDVSAHVEVGRLVFAKADGRNDDDLTIVAALFDSKGKFLRGTQKAVQLRLLDDTLQKLKQTGMTVTSTFNVAPGKYVVRLVVRDANTAQLSAQNRVVQIPR
jgi:VWFA-related protein